MDSSEVTNIIKSKGLKITPQRLLILQSIYELNNHPIADEIIAFIKERNSNISTGTIYKTLETFAEKRIVNKVLTDNGLFRYDGITETHYHLYSKDSTRIEDFYDEELQVLLTNYFENKNIANFEIEDINLHLTGKFKENK